MKLPSPQFVGYFPKRTLPKPDWLNVEVVAEIGSVSNCMSRGPEDWISAWKHNALGFFDDEPTALALAASESGSFDFYAYELYPLAALDNVVEPIKINVQPEWVAAGYKFLGFDIVTRSMGHFFECSPLSCNHAASHYVVNSYCLIDDEAQAYQALLDMSDPGAGVEPGPCYLIKVYRKELS